MTSDIAIRSTIPQLVETWDKFRTDLLSSMNTIKVSSEALSNVFAMTHGVNMAIEKCSRTFALDDGTRLLEECKKDVWRVLVNRMELRRVMSIKRMAELDKQIETGKDLPEITVDNLYAMIDSTMAQIPTLIEEAVIEVHEWLRPPGMWKDGYYKTNTEYEIKRKVIITYAVEESFSNRGFRLNYRKEQNFRALDNVFMMLDGKGTIKTYGGPLADAIKTCTGGQGETDYFKFKCYQNGNLHLEFKRLDLLAKLNAVAGGMKLKGENK